MVRFLCTLKSIIIYLSANISRVNEIYDVCVYLLLIFDALLLPGTNFLLIQSENAIVVVKNIGLVISPHFE